MMTWLLVAAGGAVGSVLRHAVNVMTRRGIGDPSPWATAIVNVVGCGAIGLLAGLVAAGHVRIGAEARTFVFVGVLGGFTTFSAFGLDTLTLAHGGLRMAAAWNIAGQVGIGLLAVFAGYAIGAGR